MLNHRTLTKCDCGLGDGFYHYGADSHHEYNPGIPEAEATADRHDDRAPVAWFFPYKDGRHVMLYYKDRPPVALKYSEHGTRQQTLAAAARQVLEWQQQPELF